MTILNGKINHKSKKEERIGEVNYNTYGRKMVIFNYINSNIVFVRFEDNSMQQTSYKNFSKGFVKTPYDKTIMGVGYIGEGKYKQPFDKKERKIYRCWNDMLTRCYGERSKIKKPTYLDCTVVEEWHNFQNFAQWFDENYYEINDETVELDKDILFKGNRVYSPETCVFVPHRINSLFVKSNSTRGNLPIGVNKEGEKFKAQTRNKDIPIYIGNYDTPQQAFEAYKIYKEKIINEVANEYRNEIPERLYNAMINYKIEIND